MVGVYALGSLFIIVFFWGLRAGMLSPQSLGPQPAMELPFARCDGVVFRPGQIVAWKRLTHEIESISNCVQNGTTATLTNVATKTSEADVLLDELKLIEDVNARAAPHGRAKEHRNLTGASYIF